MQLHSVEITRNLYRTFYMLYCRNRDADKPESARTNLMSMDIVARRCVLSVPELLAIESEERRKMGMCGWESVSRLFYR